MSPGADQEGAGVNRIFRSPTLLHLLQKARPTISEAFVVSIEGSNRISNVSKPRLTTITRLPLQALADRLAELLRSCCMRGAEGILGLAKEEHLANEQLIQEQYLGIRLRRVTRLSRPHREIKLFTMLDATKQTGTTSRNRWRCIRLLRWSGWYFANPESKYFGVGKIEKDQVWIMRPGRGCRWRRWRSG